MVFFDAYLITFLASLCIDTLNAGRPIHDLERIARKTSDPTTLQDLKKRLEDNEASAHTLLGEDLSRMKR
jgi:hypothetical protein